MNKIKFFDFKIVKLLTAVENSVEKVERLLLFNNHVKNKKGDIQVFMFEIVD